MDFQNPSLQIFPDRDRAGIDGRRPAAVLGLAPDETDLVRIILVAHLRLRHCRRGLRTDGRPLPVGEVQGIIRARDELLRRAVRRLAARVVDCTADPPQLSGSAR